jgi:hypothetical protein
MGERKVIQKYYPADFDPTKLPKKAKPKNDQIKVRVMLPMTICCNTCKEYIYKGKKFNARKETVQGEEYLGIKIFRFYIKCVKCSSEITFKTDPKNSDYRAEFGATRNYEPWKEDEKIAEELATEKSKQDADAFSKLEARTKQMKREMDALESLDELKMINARNQEVDMEDLLALSKPQTIELEIQDDEEELSNVVFQNSSNYVKKITDETVPSLPPIPKTIAKKPLPTKKKKKVLPGVVVKQSGALAGLLGNY